MTYANIPEDDILGFRAPKLHPGFNEQFEAMLRQGIVWDSSVATKPIKAPVWPYTLDYRIPHECKIDSCPTRAYPGRYAYSWSSVKLVKEKSCHNDFRALGNPSQFSLQQ